jgi:NAD(P)-dependent dehydrogenase (short-subunit alcohol dehydrogenase family)/uncharacterized OsmC-like protein
MKTVVRWRGQGSEDTFQFLGEAQDGNITPLAGRNSVGMKTASSPKEVVAMAQAACTGIDVVSTLQKMRQNLENLDVSCDVKLTDGYPSVFESCEMVYRADGHNLAVEKVAHAVELSLLKYCGVSAMIERSGCHIIPKLFVNGEEVSICDPLGKKAQALREWARLVGPSSPRGLALIVGGSRGIGRALAHQLAFLGYGVATASRSANENELAPRECDRLSLDITHPLSRAAFVDLVKSSGVEFSTVIYNAGVLDQRARNACDVDFSELRSVFETNVFAVADLNRALLPFVSTRSTLIFVSSYMGLPASNEFDFSSYRLSKCALSLYARQLGKEMVAQKRDVAVAALHPGSVATRLNPQGRMQPEESASRIAMLLDEARRSEILGRNGEFWMVKEKDARIDPWTI